MARMKRRIGLQAALAIFTIVLTLIIVFAMSAAWFTNIAQTNSLVFQVDAWGTEGSVSSETQIIAAGPGDEGPVTLKVENESALPASVCINVTKARMNSEMQKRIYFYVDVETTRNDEEINRVYLNSEDIYVYDLYGHGTLVLEDTYHNDAQLKWQWVYDVLGYYVQASVAYDSNGEARMVISEYLRPIEYNYDSATMSYVEDKDSGALTMELETVDGEATPAEFLVKYSKNDGYAGIISADNYIITANDECYYRVDVDENGTGIYAYLCTYSEIEIATQYDTSLGLAAAEAEVPITCDATVTVGVQNKNNIIVTVDTTEAFESELEAGEADVIQLVGDVKLADALVIEKDQEIIIDLNGHQLGVETTSAPFVVQEGGALTMFNGTLVSEAASDDYAVYAVGADVVLSDITVSGFKSGVRVVDSNGNGGDSLVRLVNCEMSTVSHAIIVYGNGSKSERDTQVVIDGCEIYSERGYGIGGNGSVEQGGNYGTDIQVLNSEIISKKDAVHAGIFHPQKDSKLTIYNSTVSGYTGLVIKGGTVNILDSTINGTGEQTIPTEFSKSGYIDTGDAVYVETNYEYDIKLTIGENSILHGDHGFSLQVYEADAHFVTVEVYSGVFNRVSNTTLLESYIDRNSQYVVTGNGKYEITAN